MPEIFVLSLRIFLSAQARRNSSSKTSFSFALSSAAVLSGKWMLRTAKSASVRLFLAPTSSGRKSSIPSSQSLRPFSTAFIICFCESCALLL